MNIFSIMIYIVTNFHQNSPNKIISVMIFIVTLCHNFPQNFQYNIIFIMLPYNMISAAVYVMLYMNFSYNFYYYLDFIIINVTLPQYFYYNLYSRNCPHSWTFPGTFQTLAGTWTPSGYPYTF